MTKCPICGFDEAKNTTAKVNNVMHVYVDDKTDEVFGAIQSDQDYITLKDGRVVRKQSLKKKVSIPTIAPEIKSK